MIRHNVRVHLLIRFALFALITLSVLALFWPLDSGARSASATPARFAQIDAVLAVSPTNLAMCRQCTVTVSNKNPKNSLTWFATSRGIAGVIIHPAGGMLQPKEQVSVNITMPSTLTCPANDTITFAGPVNSVNVSWNCTVTPTSPLATPPLTPTPVPPPSPTLSVSQTPTDSSLTPTATLVPNSGGSQTNGSPPPSSSAPSILLSVAALLLALLAFALYLIPPAKAPLRNRLLSLLLPVSFLRRLDQKH